MTSKVCEGLESGSRGVGDLNLKFLRAQRVGGEDKIKSPGQMGNLVLVIPIQLLTIGYGTLHRIPHSAEELASD